MKFSKPFKPPNTYKAAILHGSSTPLRVEDKEFTTLAKNEVWIQIKASPINPSDLAMLAGTYPTKKQMPYVPGLEASGLVVASGGGFMANFMLGKRVACSASETGDGTWAEYMKAPASNCIPLIKSISYEQGASAIVNPITALALIERVKQSGSNSFVNTAAAGALGKMIIRLAEKARLRPINIVHRKELIDDLKSIGANIIVDSSAPDFTSELSAICKEENPQIILDAVGGHFSDKLLEAAPPNSILVSYASLEKDFMHINPAPIIRFGKKIEGFHLAHWIGRQSKLKLLLTTRKAQNLIVEGTLGSAIHLKHQLPELNHAIADYTNEMSKGKRLLVF